MTVSVDPRLLANWDSAAHDWKVDAGDYAVAVGASSASQTLTGVLKASGATLKP